MRSIGLVLLLICSAVFAAGQEQAAPPAASSTSPTYTRDIAPILFKHCTSCHRPGQGAPMSLLSYADVRPWARAIRTQVSQRKMPPWFAEAGAAHFANDSSLPQADIDRIVGWVDGGAVRGTDPDPVPPTYTEGWGIGAPDLVLPIARPFTVPAEGIGEYQYFEIPTNLTEDRWVQAIEIRPGNRRVVHHSLAFVRSPRGGGLTLTPAPDGLVCSEDVCGEIESHDTAMGPIFAAMAVGTPPEIYPPGTAKLLPAGSVLTLQVHYTPIGTATEDRTAVGLVFAKERPGTELRMVPISKHGFVIPPRAADHTIAAEARFRKDVTIWSIGPHAHLRSKSWRFDLIDPAGLATRVLAIPRFDFNWQLVYRYTQPIAVKAGTRIVMTGVFDNSAANVANPNPDVEVRWGNMTTDEMLFASIVYSLSAK